MLNSLVPTRSCLPVKLFSYETTLASYQPMATVLVVSGGTFHDSPAASVTKPVDVLIPPTSRHCPSPVPLMITAINGVRGGVAVEIAMGLLEPMSPPAISSARAAA